MEYSEKMKRRTWEQATGRKWIEKTKTLDKHHEAVERARGNIKTLDILWHLHKVIAAYDATILELKAEREARVKAEDKLRIHFARGYNEIQESHDG